MRAKVQDTIEKRIKHKGRGKLYVNNDFADLGTPDAVRQSLQRLQKDGMLIRVHRGVYCYPKIDNVLGLGILLPTLWDIANAIARRDRITIIPTAPVALNLLGLSTQVPANAVFYTNGTSRVLKNGADKSIRFIHTNDNRLLSYSSQIMLLVVLAMREIGDGQLSERQWEQLKSYVTRVKKKEFAHDIRLAPTWIQKKLHSI